MRNRVSIVVLAILLAACNSNVQEEDTYEASVLPEKGTTSPAATPDPYEGLHAWQGNLDGKYPVLMWYRQIDSVVYGSLFYTDQEKAQPITIIGNVADGEVYLREFTGDGEVTGYWQLALTRHSAEGLWKAPSSGKSYSVSLMHIDTAVTVKDFTKVSDVTGAYNYHYAKTGAIGKLEATSFDNNSRVMLSFDNVTRAPAHNIASMKTDLLALNSNRTVYSSNEYGKCKFEVKFYTHFAVVNYIDDQAACGFGHGAHVDGVYIKQ